MLPPYDSDEVALAVQRRLLEAGTCAPIIQVIPDLRGRRWVISAWSLGGSMRGSYPFSDASGVHTPREIADWFVTENSRGDATARQAR